MPQAISKVRATFLSTIVAGVLGAQGVASFGHTDYWFPFLWYPMYSDAHFEGERLSVGYSLYGVDADGQRHRIHPADIQLDFWRFDRLLMPAVLRGDMQRVANFAPALRQRYPLLNELEVEDYPAIITRNGPVPAPVRIVARVPVGPGAADLRAAPGQAPAPRAAGEESGT
jgi:hypothetical protein